MMNMPTQSSWLSARADAAPIALARALEGATHAVNSVLGSPATMLAVTRNICEAARSSGLRRIVHLSSMALYGSATGAVDETARLQPVSAYGRAKADCELVVRDVIAGGGEAVVLRPGCVYGPGGEQWVGRIARLLQAGRLVELGKMADGYCNLTFNDDLPGAVMAALTVPEVAGETFNIADADPGTWNGTSYDSGVRSARLCDGLRGFGYFWRRPFLPRLFK
jgi:nucleoside-diphosphate-sugar epimerase